MYSDYDILLQIYYITSSIIVPTYTQRVRGKWL